MSGRVNSDHRRRQQNLRIILTGPHESRHADIKLNPKPSNLADADWKHGSTDGEVLTVIRDGVKSTGMKPFGRKMTTHQVWDVVNYVRSIGPKTGSH